MSLWTSLHPTLSDNLTSYWASEERRERRDLDDLSSAEIRNQLIGAGCPRDKDESRQDLRALGHY